MCRHDDDGALGLVVNRPLPDLSCHRVMNELGIDPGAMADVPVLAGGPVEPGRGFVLHDADYAAADTLQVGDAWALTTTLDILRAIAAGQGPRRWLLALGYAGWGAGQLEGEMAQHGWHIAPGDAGILFGTPAPSRWERAFALTGVAVAQLVATPGRA